MKISMRLFRRKNGVYYVEFKRDQIRSLKTKDENEAKTLYAAIKEEYLAGRLEQITGKCTKSLQDFYNEYLEIGPDLEDSKKTFYANRLALRKLRSIAGGQIKLDKISKKHIDILIAQCKRDDLSISSINNYIRHSKAILTRAVGWKYLKVNPLRNIRQIKTERKKPKAIDRKAVPNFISSIEDQDLKLMVVAYLTTGRRRCELLMLEDTDFDFKIDKYFVRRSKDHLSRWYPIGSGFMAVINNLKVDGKLPAGRLFKKWSHPDPPYVFQYLLGK
jgi:integrase